ncbi:hypothetical protein KAU37_10635 [Candidatus Bipolaricaulota bacterium]|nr:hypothetical protein [Candidatus Bipolaricaulota bacterium]
MTGQWVIAIASLVGTALGGAIALLSGSILARKREAAKRRALLLEKLEQVSETAIRVEVLMAWAWAVALQEAMCHEPVEREEHDRVPLEQLRMLAELYFPKLVDAASDIETAHGSLGPFLVEAMDIGRKRKPPRNELADDLNRTYDNLRASVRKFLDQASITARDLLG